MKVDQKIASLSILLLSGIIAVLLYVVIAPTPVRSAADSRITGYGWSENIGWVSFSCINTGTCGTSNYGLSVSDSGTISGYAWSDNIGWISANSADVSGCPSAPCTPVISIVTGKMSGWMRALSQDGGWDGWISLGGVNYGPTLSAATKTFSGHVWGSDVIGWMTFDYATTTFQSCTPNTNVCMDSSTIRHYNNDCTYTDATCQFSAYGFNCVSGACQTPDYPGPGWISNGITAVPRIVRAGKTTTLMWKVLNANPATCTVTGTNGDSWSGSASSTVTTSGITKTTVFSLHCNGDDVSILTYDSSVTVSIAPTYEEI